MDQEKIKKIGEVLKADMEHMKDILELSPAEAAKKFTELGCGDVTEQEMVELAEEIKKMAAHLNTEGELDETALEGVAGGASVEGVLYTALGVTVVSGAAMYGVSCLALAALVSW